MLSCHAPEEEDCICPLKLVPFKTQDDSLPPFRIVRNIEVKHSLPAELLVSFSFRWQILLRSEPGIVVIENGEALLEYSNRLISIVCRHIRVHVITRCPHSLPQTV